MCKFDEAWVGRCREEPDKDFCKKHAGKKCQVCGEQATHSCPETFSLVCGTPLCDDYRCKVRHHPKHHSLTYKEWCEVYQVPIPDGLPAPPTDKMSYEQFVETTLAALGVVDRLMEDILEVLKDKYDVTFAYRGLIGLRLKPPYNFEWLSIQIRGDY